ncbi:hypothetical protein [Chthonobacter rhizosphaerae]|uniref:hypothetical protein n=1 Tax=Chthonobacter rhizosphaerae TaxID=2735553 RepID=UPI001FE94799|nr:hypothetical protein [Chthonobacter rhizosphaerae]
MEDPFEPEAGSEGQPEGASDEEVDAWRRALEEDEPTTPSDAGTGLPAEGGELEAVDPAGTNVVPFRAEEPEVDDREAAPTIEASPAGFVETADRPRRPIRAKKPVKKAKAGPSAVLSAAVLTIAGGIVVGTIAGAFLARETAVRLVPDLAGLYALAGLEVNLRGLEFGPVETRREMDGATPVLVVDGSVRNVTEGARPVARIRFGLISSTGRELYAWTMEPAKSTLDPGETMPFKSRLPAPPEAASTVSVRFSDAPPG